MKKDTGGQAFPQTTTESFGGMPSTSVEGGMTLRDWFAGQALVGIAGQSKEFTDALVINARARGMESEQHAAEIAYSLADCMLAERSKP